MFKHSVFMQLTLFMAVAAAITGCLSFLYLESTPFLLREFPQWRFIHEELPFVVDGLFSLVSLIFSTAAFAEFTVLRRALKHGFSEFEVLNNVLYSADFGEDGGVFYMDETRKILTASQLTWRAALKSTHKDLVGKRCDEVFPDKFNRLLDELIERAIVTRSPAAVDISDWGPYGLASMGPTMVIVNPALKLKRPVGFAVVFRSLREFKLAEDSAIMHQKKYQSLFDNLEVGVAIFRPAVSDDGGPDGYVTEANSAFKRILEGIPLPYTQPASVVWPGIMNEGPLRDGITQVMGGAPSAKCEIFSPLLGKHIAISLSVLPGGRVLVVVADQTEARMHEAQLLAFHERLQRSLTVQSEYLSRVVEDMTNFNQASIDVAEAHLEAMTELIPSIPEPLASKMADACTSLHKVQSQFIRYYAASGLPYKEHTLVSLGEVVSRLTETFNCRHRNISFTVESLPTVVGSQEVLASILEQLLTSLANLPNAERAKIEIGGKRDFLSTGLYVAAWGFDYSQLFVEIPPNEQVLDWTLTSDLDLALVRAMVFEHGGQLSLGPTKDGDGVRVAFTIGTPL